MDQGLENGAAGEAAPVAVPRLTPEEYQRAINSTAAQSATPEERYGVMQQFAADLATFGEEEGATEAQIQEAQRSFLTGEIAARPDYFGVKRANQLDELRQQWESGVDSTWNGRVVLGKGKGPSDFNAELRASGLNPDGTTSFDAWKAMGGDQRGLGEVVMEGGRQVKRMLEGAFVKGPLNPFENDYDEALRDPKAQAFFASMSPQDRENYRKQVADVFGISEGKADGWLAAVGIQIANLQTPEDFAQRFPNLNDPNRPDNLPSLEDLQQRQTQRLLNGLMLMLSTRQAMEDYEMILDGLGSMIGAPIVRKASEIAPGLTGRVMAAGRGDENLKNPDYLRSTLEFERDRAAYDFFRRMEGSANQMRENAVLMADVTGMDVDDVLQIAEGMSLITDPATIAGFAAGAGFKGAKSLATGAVKGGARVAARTALAEGSFSGAKAALRKGAERSAAIADFRILPEVLPKEGTTAFLLGKMGKLSRGASDLGLRLERRIGGEVVEQVTEGGQKLVNRVGGSPTLKVAIGATGGLIAATQIEGDFLEKTLGVAGAAGLSPFIARKGLVVGSRALRATGDRFLIASTSKAAADGTLEAGRLAARLHGLAYDDAAFARATGLFGSRFGNWAMQATDNAIEGALVDGALGYVATGSWQGAVEEAVSGAVFDNIGYYTARGASRVESLLTRRVNVPRGATVGFYNDPLALEADRRSVGEWMKSLDEESRTFTKAMLDDGTPESVATLRNLMDVALFHKVPVLLTSGQRNADIVTRAQIGDELFDGWAKAKEADDYNPAKPVAVPVNLRRDKPLTGEFIQRLWDNNKNRQNQGFKASIQTADGSVVPHLVVNMEASRDPVSTLRHEGFHALHDIVQLADQRDAFVEELAKEWGLDDETKLAEAWETRQQQNGNVAFWDDLTDPQKKDARRWLLNELGADYFQFLLTPRAEGMKGGLVSLAQQLAPGAKNSPFFWGLANRMMGAMRLKLEELGVNTGLGGLYDGNGQKITARRALTRGKTRDDSVSYRTEGTAANAIRNLEISDVLNAVEKNDKTLQALLDKIEDAGDRATIRRLYEFGEDINEVAKTHGTNAQKMRAKVRGIVNEVRKGFTDTDRATFGLRKFAVDPAKDGTFRVAEIRDEDLMQSTRELDKLAAELVIGMERLNEAAQFETERRTSEAFLELQDQIEAEKRSRSQGNKDRARQATEEARQQVSPTPQAAQPSNAPATDQTPPSKETVQAALEALEDIPVGNERGAVKVRRNAKGTLQASGRFFTEAQLAALETVFPEHMMQKIREMNPELRDNFGADHLVFHRPATKQQGDNARQFANRPLQQDRVVALGWNMDTRQDGNVRLQTIVLDGIDEKGQRKGLMVDLDREQQKVNNGEPSVLAETFGDIQEADRKLQIYLARLAQGQPGAGGKGALRITPKERDVLNSFLGIGVVETSLAKKAGKPDPADEFGRTPNPNPGRQIRKGEDRIFNSLRVERIDEIRAGEGVGRYPIDYQGLSMNFEPPEGASRLKRAAAKVDVVGAIPRLITRMTTRELPTRIYNPLTEDLQTQTGFNNAQTGLREASWDIREQLISRVVKETGVNDIDLRDALNSDGDSISPRGVDRLLFEKGVSEKKRARLVEATNEALAQVERMEGAMELIANPSADGAKSMAGFILADLRSQDKAQQEGKPIDQATLFELAAVREVAARQELEISPYIAPEDTLTGDMEAKMGEQELPPMPGQEIRPGPDFSGFGDLQFEPVDASDSEAVKKARYFADSPNPEIAVSLPVIDSESIAEHNALVEVLEVMQEQGALDPAMLDEMLGRYASASDIESTLQNLPERDMRWWEEIVESHESDLEKESFSASKTLHDWVREQVPVAPTGDDLRVAGYILPNGDRLLMSHDGRQRDMDHREIRFPGTPGGTEGMIAMMNSGMMRIDANSGSIGLRRRPTRAQADAIFRIFVEHGEAFIDAERPGADGFNESARMSIQVTEDIDNALKAIDNFYKATNPESRDLNFEPADEAFSGVEFGEDGQAQRVFAGVADPGELIKVAAFDADRQLVDVTELRADGDGNVTVNLDSPLIATLELEGETGPAKVFQLADTSGLTGEVGSMAGEFIQGTLADFYFPDSSGIAPARDLTREAGIDRLPTWNRRTPQQITEQRNALNRASQRAKPATPDLIGDLLTRRARDKSLLTETAPRERLSSAWQELADVSQTLSQEARARLAAGLDAEIREASQIDVPARVRPGRFLEQEAATFPPTGELQDTLAIAIEDMQTFVADEAVTRTAVVQYYGGGERNHVSVLEAGDDRRVIRVGPEASVIDILKGFGELVAPERREAFNTKLRDLLEDPDQLIGTWYEDTEGVRHVRALGDEKRVPRDAMRQGVVIDTDAGPVNLPLRTPGAVNRVNAGEGLNELSTNNEAPTFQEVFAEYIFNPATALLNYGPITLAMHDALQGSKPAVEMIEIPAAQAKYLADRAVRQARPSRSDLIAEVADAVDELGRMVEEAAQDPTEGIPDAVYVEPIGNLEDILAGDPGRVLGRIEELGRLNKEARDARIKRDAENMDRLERDMDLAIEQTRKEIEALRAAEEARRNTPTPEERQAAKQKASTAIVGQQSMDALRQRRDRVGELFRRIDRSLAELGFGDLRTAGFLRQSNASRARLAKLKETKPVKQLEAALDEQQQLVKEIEAKRQSLQDQMQEIRQTLLNPAIAQIEAATSRKQLEAVAETSQQVQTTMAAIRDRILAPLAEWDQQQKQAQELTRVAIQDALTASIQPTVLSSRVPVREKIRLIRETFDNDQGAIERSILVMDQGEGYSQNNRVPDAVIDALLPGNRARIDANRGVVPSALGRPTIDASRRTYEPAVSVESATNQLATINEGLNDTLEVFARVEQDVARDMRDVIAEAQAILEVAREENLSPAEVRQALNTESDLQFEPADDTGGVTNSNPSSTGNLSPDPYSNLSQDAYFPVPTLIAPTENPSGQTTPGTSGPAYGRAREIADRAGVVRDQALRVLGFAELDGEGPAAFSQEQAQQVSDWIATTLSFSEEHLDAATTPAEIALANAIRDFRELVPLVPANRITELTTSDSGDANSQAAAIEGLRDLLNEDRISEDQFRGALTKAAADNAIDVDLADLDAAAETIIATLDAKNAESGKGAAWIEEGSGAEAKAYRDDGNNVYKLSPIRADVLAVAEIGDGPLTLRADQPPLFATDGSMPVFERRVAENGFTGHALTETAAITDDGRVVIKQPYMGRNEPSADTLKAKAEKDGHAVLPPQTEDPNFGGDVNLTPVVIEIDGEFWLILDYNPRNSREIDGQAIPFDVVSKRLTAEEIAANPDLKAAVGSLQAKS